MKSTKLALGTIVRINIDGPDLREAARICEHAFTGIEKVEELMSAYRADSEVGILNDHGVCDGISDETCEVLEKALHYWKITDGAFDISAFPVRKSFLDKDVAGPEGPDRANSQDIMIDKKHVSFRRKGLGINLGGIAKGYAVDEAIRILSENGVKNALVDAGGDIRVIGKRTDGSPWRIGLADPKSARKITSVIEITDAAVATSGTYRRGVADIIDARNGRAADSVLRATVVAGKAVDADALATCVYVLGAGNGIRLINGLDNVAALVLSRDGRMAESGRWESLTRPQMG